jgi:pantoate--beta-alanine ligase
MQILKTRAELDLWLQSNPHPAYVPTMGALHKGHLSLVDAAKQTTKPVLVTVFVNPRQFGPNEDFATYPRDAASDAAKLEQAGANAVWFATEDDVYGEDFQLQEFELPKVFSELEGELRPTHFDGVAQVLHRFFSIIAPSVVVFGQKDFQQTVLVRWLLENYFTKKNGAASLPPQFAAGSPQNIELKICSIVREPHGLALSSRNEYLSPEARKQAAIIHTSIQDMLQMYAAGESSAQLLEERFVELVKGSSIVEKIDYAQVRDANTFERLEVAKPGAVFVTVVRIGGVRLLDNLLF